MCQKIVMRTKHNHGGDTLAWSLKYSTNVTCSDSSQQVSPNTSYLLSRNKWAVQDAKKKLLLHILNSKKKQQQKKIFKRHLWKRVTAVTRTMRARLMSNGKSPFRVRPRPSERHNCHLNCWNFKYSKSSSTAMFIHFQGNPLAKDFSLGFSWL